MAAIFLASNIPPTRPRFIWRIAAAPARNSRAKSYFVVNRSPVAMGIDVALATLAISSGASGGTGSSSQSGSYGSSRLASRIAPAAVICPCVPNSKSAFIPTASRKDFANRAHRSSASNDNWRPSNAEYGPAGSNFSAVKPWARYSADRSAARSGS